MIALRRLNKNCILAVPLYNVTARYFSTQSPKSSLNAVPSTSEYDDLINAAGRKRDFTAVRHLLSRRSRDGLLNTNNTFRFIATDPSVLDELLQSLAAIDDWFTRKNAHDALVAQLSKLYRTAEALRVAETMARKKYGATAATFHPIINALARKKEMSAAWVVLDVMRACKVRPALTSYNYILSGHCFLGDVASAAEALGKMEAEGIRADSMTYDALVQGACKAGKVEAALVVMRRMVEVGVPALHSTYLHIISEMLRRRCDRAALEFVGIFAGRDKKLDAESFGFLARRLKNMKRIAEAKVVVEEMVKRGLPIADGIGGFGPKFT
ncbi:Pentatricopeptide repeat-containing protein, mitochondrial [Sesamum alatum]|uniref:Pentatricopeptide repeat-containing protein, mitochondrial n=1 Tax=Sesamum alatum TaxID=300844 RepID=A0AAE1YUU4_9LAMI|nr:Pentatricopeptide repeat-containing protein, mitochondrial [Sesamum alatum]